MNKQEAIEEIKNMATLKIRDTTVHQQFDTIDKQKALDIISQINESQKVVVPQFVAEYIEYCKYEKFYALHGAYADMDDRLTFWRFKGNNSELFAKAWLYGYEIEKERLYTARLKLISVKKYNYINREKDEKELFISDSDGLTDVYQTHFTQAELEELDIWDNPAFEIEEVEK